MPPPHDDQVRFRHLARVRPAGGTDTGRPSGIGNARPDRVVLPRIAHDVAQPVDPVPLHQAHRAGEVVGPDAGRAVPRRALSEAIGHQVERLVPASLAEPAFALGAGADQRPGQPPGMMDALGVARHLGADHALRVRVVARAADGGDPAAVLHLHFEGAGARAIMRAGGETERHADQVTSGRAMAQASCGRIARRRARLSDGQSAAMS